MPDGAKGENLAGILSAIEENIAAETTAICHMLHHMKSSIEEVRAARTRLQVLRQMAAGMKKLTAVRAGAPRKKTTRAKSEKSKAARPARKKKETGS